MIHLTVVLLIVVFYISMKAFPEYTVVWAVLNTFAYAAVIEKTVTTFKTLEDISANIVGWFIAPFFFWTML